MINGFRAEVRNEINLIKPLDEVEQAARADALAWIDSGVEICRLKKPAVPPKHLISYFAVVDGEYLLLVDHINAELWLPTGGHVEPGEHPRTTVLREAKEELGLDGEFLLDQPVFLTITETVGKTAGHTDVSIWYVLRGNRHSELVFDTTEFHSIRWFHRDDVPFDRTDKHMGRFLQKLYGPELLCS
ncbi:MAG: NUDIX hydrolase [Pseudomonadaceae bacterium]|nr:NUDIX hydrolase [Pseudomonadaceae bacterium]